MLDRREFELRVKALQKAREAKEAPTSIISVLDGLKDFRPTEEMLRTTKAGLIVGHLRKDPNKDVCKAATTIVTKWRKFVEEEKKSKQVRGSASPAGKAMSPAPKPVATSSNGGGGGGSSGGSSNKKTYEGNPETRKFTTDNVDIQRTGSKVRDNSIGVLYNGLAYRSREPEDVVLNKAIEVEAAAFKAYKGEGQPYKEKVRSLFQNLKVKTNAELGRNVMSGVIAPEKFVVMTSKQLLSAEQRQADAKLEEENMKKAQVPKEERSISDTLECSNCKMKMVSYSQAQTRSADEPMTTFCLCTNCGKRWKFS
ncbi:transcription elongation factor [Poronia punctata]|nr:transcription elongation factor [Poronia punctata]